MGEHDCQICNNEVGNRRHPAREMMFGTREKFTYLECAGCGCLQLLNPPGDMAPYYPSGYYSFKAERKPSNGVAVLKRYLRSARNRGYLLRLPSVSAAIDRILPYPSFRAFADAEPALDSRILDVGCGAGHLLKDIASLGFRRILGVDPFLESDIKYESGLEIRKCSLEGLEGTAWDLIMFHHSFEHLLDPVATLKLVAERLSPGGRCLIRVPVPTWPWKTYGVDWVELEAPRHVFLLTEQSLSLLAKRAGLELLRTEYDSDEFQFWGSELYRRDIPLTALESGGLRKFFSSRELSKFRGAARALNNRNEGGRAAFYLGKA
jgi:SAM-dependent methyltransferase